MASDEDDEDAATKLAPISSFVSDELRRQLSGDEPSVSDGDTVPIRVRDLPVPKAPKPPEPPPPDLEIDGGMTIRPFANDPISSVLPLAGRPLPPLTGRPPPLAARPPPGPIAAGRPPLTPLPPPGPVPFAPPPPPPMPAFSLPYPPASPSPPSPRRSPATDPMPHARALPMDPPPASEPGPIELSDVPEETPPLVYWVVTVCSFLTMFGLLALFYLKLRHRW
jgi:hypothetical protein